MKQEKQVEKERKGIDKEMIGMIIITRNVKDKRTSFSIQTENINPDEAIGIMTRMISNIMEGLNQDSQRLAKENVKQNYFG